MRTYQEDVMELTLNLIDYGRSWSEYLPDGQGDEISGPRLSCIQGRFFRT